MTQPKLSGFPPTRVEEPLLEKQLQSAVIDLARVLGYRVAHFRSVPVKRGPTVRWETPVQADGKGFPDLVLVGLGRVVWAELKVGSNTLSDDQRAWLDDLRAAGEAVFVWTDKDWHRGDIETELRRAA